MKKKLTIISLVVALMSIAIVGTSLAYFTADDEKENTFTVGNVKIELTEEKWDKAVENTENENMYPGQTIDKDPVVTNIGNNPAFVRVSVTGLDQFVEKYGKEAVIATSELGTNWKDGEDGYYYYLLPLAKDAKTTALFETITLPTELENQEETKGIVVTAYAVQAQGIDAADPEAPTLAELTAWFTTIMG